MSTTSTNTPRNPVWLITGASSGFGLALAKETLSRSHAVIATSRSTSSRGMVSLASLGAQTLALDVTASESELSETIAKAASLVPGGRITHVVNCAGYILEGAVEETTQEEVRKVFETNVLGSVNVARAVVGKLRETKGVLVNMGSLGSWMSGGGFALYCSTKWAVSGLTEGLRDELKPFGIRVCCVEPGYTRTSFLAEGGGHRFKAVRALERYDGLGYRERLNAYNGEQPGDVDRCAVAMVDLLTGTGMAEGKEIPMRLVLGSDCLEVVRNKCESTLKLVKAWETVSRFADGQR
ncbi:hypothetical protein QBC36DRAFT_137258 [Triangularia setosa]|uniref:Ketoreductase domain-containing protein n=1 Tax=Triangularia setosa TaxID=2587417 RepID=A0AAN6WFB3_9PEZI|nr:hypothetical protein QBC36DRAFT_137258 [Podospora setosa]